MARRSVILSLALMAIAFAAMSGCKANSVPAAQSPQTMKTLRSICTLAWSTQSDPYDPVPTTLPVLVNWMKRNMPGMLEPAQKTIQDEWGKDIVIIVKNGKFFGVGSAGPDGVWQNGTGDDLKSTLDDFKSFTH